MWPSDTGIPTYVQTTAGAGVSGVRMTGLAPVGPAAAGGPDTNYATGLHRMIGLAFEVMDVTPQLYQGGTCTMYRQNQYPVHTLTSSSGWSNINNPNVPIVNPDTFVYRAPPSTESVAYLTPNAIKRPAKEGAYVVCVQDGLENPLEYPTGRVHAYLGGDPAPLDPPAYIPCLMNNGTLFAGNAYPGCFSGTRFHTGGAIFSGLQKQAVLSLSVRFIMERAPTVTESDLYVLARPAPAYDPVAFALYTEAMRLMPVGCRIRDNALGDWFRSAVSAVSDKLAPVLKHVAPVLEGAARMHPMGAKIMAVKDAVMGPRASGSRPSAAPDHVKAKKKGGKKVKK